MLMALGKRCETEATGAAGKAMRTPRRDMIEI
jgi:hypothetical protein